MIGLIAVYAAGALTRAVIGPIAKSTVKGTAKIGMGLKKISHEAASEIHGIAAEASADVAAKKRVAPPKAKVEAPKVNVEPPKVSVEPPKATAETTKPATVIVNAKK